MKAVVLAMLAACSAPARPHLARAGQCDNTRCDEGGGDLARSSMRLELGGEDSRRDDPAGAGAYGGDAYGGDAYGGDLFGGSTYGGWAVPQWVYQPPNRVPHYNVADDGDLTAAIEGVVTWAGPAPAKVLTPCGTIDNPTLRVSGDRAVRGAIVYVDKVSVGRTPINYGKPAAIGGTLAKRGCALVPAAQIVTPLPASIAVHGDRQHARIRIADRSYDLQEAGLVQAELKPGVTKVDGDDGRIAAAWVLALDTVYFAITDDAGRFRIDELASGTYDVTFWQPPAAVARPDGTLGYGAPLVVHRTVKVDAARPSHVDVVMH